MFMYFHVSYSFVYSVLFLNIIDSLTIKIEN